MNNKKLVESLRSCAMHRCDCEESVKDGCWDGMLIDAADAIEELKSQVVEWQETSAYWNNEYYALYDSQSRWTAVEDALPDESGRYLVFLRYYDFDEVFTAGDLSYVTEMFFDKAQMLWNDNAAGQSFNAVLSAVNRNEVQAVTHWMPLPKAPEDEA